jgi:site-specific DNA recombinase
MPGVSTEHGLEQDFNSLDAQRDAAQAYIRSQAHAGWTLIRSRYDDGGYSGGSTERPALQRLLADVRTRKVDVIVVYKVDRLTRSLADFAKLVELFDDHGVSLMPSPRVRQSPDVFSAGVPARVGDRGRCAAITLALWWTI